MVQSGSVQVYALRKDGVIDTWIPAPLSNWSRHYSLKAAVILGVITQADFDAYKQAEKARAAIQTRASDARELLSLAEDLGMELTGAQISLLQGLRDEASAT